MQLLSRLQAEQAQNKPSAQPRTQEVVSYTHLLDESTPHIHERHVFDCENKYGEVAPQQEKALEALGFDLPDPDKPLSLSLIHI